MYTKVSIGAIQPLAVKWTSFLVTAGFCGLLALMFVWSTARGHWLAFPVIALLLALTYFQTLNTANVYVCGPGFVIEHALKGTIHKDAALYRKVETSYFYYQVVFADGTSYYFSPSFTGLWKAFIKDSQGYSNYVRDLANAAKASSSSVPQEPA